MFDALQLRKIYSKIIFCECSDSLMSNNVCRFAFGCARHGFYIIFNQEEGTFSNVKVFISDVPIRISNTQHRHKQVIELHVPRVGAGCDHCFQSKYGAFWEVNTHCLAPFILELAVRDTFVHIPHHCSFFLV